jgi:hypothetical protein
MITIDDIADSIETIVDDLTYSGEMFSAFDITRLVRIALPTTKVMHKTVRDILRREINFTSTGYTEQTYHGDSFSTQVWVPPGGDVNNYNPDGHKPSVPAVIKFMAPKVPTTYTATNAVTINVSNATLKQKRSGPKAHFKDQKDGKVYWTATPNASGKLVITKDMILTLLGASITSPLPLGTLWIAPRAHNQDGLVVLTKQPANPAWSMGRAIKRCNITVPKKALAKARLTTPMKVTVTDGVIVITSANA